MDGLKRGELARRCGVNPETIRYYEKRGLLPRARRSPSNYRIFGEDAVRRVRFVMRAKELGFTLAEIRELLALRAAPGARCADVLHRAKEKIRDIDGKLRTLRAMRKALVDLIAECRGREPIRECPILEALEG